MAETSSWEMIPAAPSIAAWALEPAISSRHSRRSTSMDALISSMIAAGPRENRPPHIWFSCFLVLSDMAK